MRRAYDTYSHTWLANTELTARRQTERQDGHLTCENADCSDDESVPGRREDIHEKNRGKERGQPLPDGVRALRAPDLVRTCMRRETVENQRQQQSQRETKKGLPLR